MNARVFLAILVSVLYFPTWCSAEDSDSAKQKQAAKQVRKAKPAKRKHVLVTPAREAAALAFVEDSHPELASVLRQLKTMQPEHYEQAIADLFETSERLAETQSRDPDRYALDLEEWKLQSRIELLAARLTRKSSKSLQGELEELLYRQLDVRLQQQELEKARLQSRMRRVDAAIDRLKKDREKMVAGQLRRLTGSKASATEASSRKTTPREQTKPR